MPLFSLADRRPALRGARRSIAHHATVVGSVLLLRAEVRVRFQAVIRAANERIHIGEGTNIRDRSVPHADPGFRLTLGRRVSVEPPGEAARLHGRRG